MMLLSRIKSRKFLGQVRSIPREDTGNDATMWDSSKDATLDINLDGKKETIVLFDHASGAGCGSYRQWLREFTPNNAPYFLKDRIPVLKRRSILYSRVMGLGQSKIQGKTMNGIA